MGSAYFSGSFLVLVHVVILLTGVVEVILSCSRYLPNFSGLLVILLLLLIKDGLAFD